MNNDKIMCSSCEEYFDEEYIISGTDPYFLEIEKRRVLLDLCFNCYSEHCDDI